MIHKLVSVMVAAASTLLVAATCSVPATAQDSQNGVPPTLGAPPALHGPDTAPPVRTAAIESRSTAGDAASAEYRFGPGDRIRINVFGQQDFSGTYTVDSAGDLSFPLIGTLRAGGLTGPELQRELVAKLSPKYLKSPSISVEMISYRPFYILGEVRAPGSYPYVSNMTALQAIAIAGGFTYRAREEDFRVTRRAGPSGDHITLQQDSIIEPGDVIYVRERYF